MTNFRFFGICLIAALLAIATFIVAERAQCEKLGGHLTRLTCVIDNSTTSEK